MATKESALQRYTDAQDKLEQHIKDNQKVFDDHQKIVLELMDRDNELRDAVAEDGKGITNGLWNVTVTPQTQRVYNEDKMKQYMSGTQFADVVSDVTRPARITIGKARE